METNEKRGPKDLAGKRDWSIFPFRECGAVVDVFSYGAQKYGRPFSYRDGIPTGELLAAIIRHAIQIQEGHELDAESGLPHMAHIAANALMAMSQSIMTEEEDKWKAWDRKLWHSMMDTCAFGKRHPGPPRMCIRPTNMSDGLCTFEGCPYYLHSQ